ncbi:MAG TPA: DUF3574 domain-containing protein [Roseomonas sp.]|nr:DUF3574 domain-containing protein [Roseomonas sp.]
MPLDNATFVSPAIGEAPAFALDTVTRLYMGRRIPLQHVARRPDGAVDERQATVRDAAVDRFISDVVAQHFPDGFTVLHGEGGWMDSATGRPIREPSLIVEVMHSAAQADAVRNVAAEWKRRFKQDAVMAVSSPVAVSFI